MITAIQKKNTKYLFDRLNALQIDENLNIIHTPVGGFSKDTRKNVYFDADEYGNIVINYYTLRSTPTQFKKSGNKWGERFVRKRIHNPKPDINGKINKYLSPKGSGLFPFFPPQILNKYKTKKKITTLYVTEGEFKAFKGCMSGIDVIGIPSIQGFYDTYKADNDKIKIIAYEIEELIKTCSVENIVFLTDADTMTLNYKYEKEMKSRPLSFFSAVNNFRKSMNLLLKKKLIKKVYFSHINTSFTDNAKGLDDLLVEYSVQEENIKKDLYKLDKSKKYFTTHDITDPAYNIKLHKYFGLDNVKNFYKIYAQYLNTNHFVFDNAVYYYDYTKVVFYYHKDVDKFMRVGADWFKKVKNIKADGSTEDEIIPFTKTEIKEDYAKFPGFLQKVHKYDNYTALPNWTGDHQFLVERYGSKSYNLYNPMYHTPEEGSWITIYKFLKHIFEGEGWIDFEKNEEHQVKGDIFSVALDYLTIMYLYPTHQQITPLLVSKEEGTGKTKFLELMAEIYKGNSNILNDAQFNMQFNRHYVTKYFIGIDEAIMGADTKEAKKGKERLKSLITLPDQKLEDKGVNLKSIPFYGKIVMTSNDANNLMKLSDDDTRWFVVYVNPVKPEDYDVDLLVKMKKEIPAFLYFLKNRPFKRGVFHKRKMRFWFETEDYLTDQFHLIKANTKSQIEKAIEHYIKDMFFTYELEEIKLPPKYILERLNEQRTRKFSATELEEKFKEVYKLVKQKQNRFKIPIALDHHSGNVQYMDERKIHYIFRMKDWLTEDEIKKINNAELV
jgi:hypothetical protein